MSILMIHTSYNELNLLRYKQEHCMRNDIYLFVIDNMSNDGSVEWMEENNIPHSFIDTEDSFDLRPLLDEMTRKIHQLKPDWLIYAGVDMFYESKEGLRTMIENADRDGYTQIQMGLRTTRNIGEGKKEGNPFANHFYVGEKGHRTLISKYDKSIKIVADRILRDNIVLKEDGGTIFEMHASKSVEERMETLKRRQKAWDNGLNYGAGCHYRESFIFDKSKCFDIHELEEFELYKRLQEL